MKQSVVLGLVFLAFAALASGKVVRKYYVAAVEREWDYAPTGNDMFLGVPLDQSEHAQVFCVSGPNRIGRKYKKALYVEYTDASFTVEVPRDPSMGFLGPVLRGEVGDVLEVHFLNRATRPYSMHPHGVFYDKQSEGAHYQDGIANKAGAVIQPGDQYTYIWEVRESSGPGPADPSSIVWYYHSHVHETKDVYSGLVGPIVVYQSGMMNSTDFDEERHILLMVMDENESHYLADNIQKYCGDPASVVPDDPDFMESNLMHVVNGLVFCNLEQNVCLNDRVRWYVAAFGTEVDLHTAHWHGHTLLFNGHRKDVLDLLPASMQTLDMVADNFGKWLFHCHVHDHISAGMSSYFDVSRCESRKKL